MRRLRPILLILILLAAWCVTGPATAAGPQDFFLPADQWLRFRNRAHPGNDQGSCVFASWAASGCHEGVIAAECLLENDDQFGPPELGGAWPERVQRVAQKRGIPIYNIEGPETIEWIDWALDQGHYASITYGQAHMINVIGRDAAGRYWLWDNNYPDEQRPVDRNTFLREHRLYGGGWAVIGKLSGPPPWTRPKPEPRKARQ